MTLKVYPTDKNLQFRFVDGVNTDLEILQRNLIESWDPAKENDVYSIEWEHFLSILNNEEEAEAALSLELPAPYPYEIEFRQKGILGRPDFQYDVRYVRDGLLLNIKKVGAWITIENEGEYLLSDKQYASICEAEIFNAKPPEDRKDQVEQFKSLSNIKNASLMDKNKDLAKEGDISLKEGLGGKSINKPDKIKVEVSVDALGGVCLGADVGVGSSEEVKRAFQTGRNVLIVRNKEGQPHYIVLTPNTKEAIKKIIDFNKLPRESRERFWEEPLSFLDTEGIDPDQILDTVYSARVKGIGPPPSYRIQTIFKKGLDAEWKVLEETVDALGNPVKGPEPLRGEDEPHDDEESGTEVSAPTGGIEKSLGTGGKYPLPPDQSPPPGIKKGLVPIIYTNFEGEEFVVKYNLKPEDYETLEIPASFSKDYSLKNHQKVGLHLLQNLYKQEYPGILLADDMGLGKTLQILSFAAWLFEKNNSGDILIAAPVILLENWAKEWQTFFPSLRNKITVLYGKQLRRYTEVVEGVKCLKIDKLTGKGLIITNYETIRRYSLNLAQMPFEVVACDEAQWIKNPTAAKTLAIKSLNTKFRIITTATPIENSLDDLWSLMDFIAPGNLGSLKEFQKRYSKRIINTEDKKKALQIADELRDRCAPMYLRRTKHQILEDLPPKNIVTPPNYAHMEEKQAKIYQDILAKIGNDHVFSVLPRLFAIMSLPPVGEEDYVIPKVAEVFSILDEIKKKQEKVIIFTQFRKVQLYLSLLIEKKYKKSVQIIAGNVDNKSRNARLNCFKRSNGFDIIIMSPIAAGIGLNITEANHVIHYTRHWNPAKEDQATDRVYRIGQEKPVFVHYVISKYPRFYTQGATLEEAMHNLIERKRKLLSDFAVPTKIGHDELLDELKPEIPECECSPVTLKDVDKMSDIDFERLCALIYKLVYGKAQKTPWSGDHGADVIAFTGDQIVAIQCKHSRVKDSIGPSGVREVNGGATIYSKKYKKEIAEKIVVTNSSFTKQAKIEAKQLDVKLVDREKLRILLEKCKLSIGEVQIQK